MALTQVYEMNENIFLYAPLNDLLTFCRANKQAQKICHSSTFWLKRFNLHGFRQPRLLYNTLQEWVIAYDAESYMRYRVQSLLRILKSPTKRDFDRGVQENELGPLFVTQFSWYFLSFLNNHTINMIEVLTAWHLLQNEDAVDEQIQIMYQHDNDYLLSFHYHKIENQGNKVRLDYHVTKQTMIDLLYIILESTYYHFFAADGTPLKKHVY